MQAGDRIGDRYELTYPVGRGGMGQVWAGFDDRLDRPVAVKFLRQLEVPQGERETAVKRFRREARATARLDHPGVPAVHDLGVHGEDLYIVMQLVRGMVLADHIAEQEQLSVGEAARIAAQICSVLTAAHTASLVHRDLKPQNLMVTPSGVVKVLDFGVAALLDPAGASRLTAPGRALGTPAYIAPEQAAGRPAGPAADLYALGCVVFEMLAGQPPYQAANALDVMQRHLRSPIPIISEHRPDVPDDLAHLLYCLLAKDPMERPTSAAEVQQILTPFIGSESLPVPRLAGAMSVPAAPSPRQEAGQDTTELLARARELAEHERYTQAAELLESVLLTAGEAHEHQPLPAEIAALRFDLANLYMLAGDFRRACEAFEVLAEGLDRSADAHELADDCRQQAAACRVALGDTTVPSRLGH
ncbi:serine/threonine-protein kinase [Micromonospora musae]|uniref:serine/threonine-protein kinase n=1 Tax=Micromonospora musae TaxID=1894970 RepID=UPI003415A9E0